MVYCAISVAINRETIVRAIFRDKSRLLAQCHVVWATLSRSVRVLPSKQGDATVGVVGCVTELVRNYCAAEVCSLVKARLNSYRGIDWLFDKSETCLG
jgi:hypothetical protein